MASVVVRTVLNADSLALPELRELLGKRVEIRAVEEESGSAIDRMLDHEFHAMLEAEFAADPSPLPTIEEVRAALSRHPMNMAADIIAEREER